MINLTNPQRVYGFMGVVCPAAKIYSAADPDHIDGP